MRSEMALWPQPAHSVVLPPLYAWSSSPIRLTLSGVAMVRRLLSPRHSRADARALPRHLEPFLRQHLVGDAAGVDRQPVVVQYAPQPGLALRRELELHQLEQL